MATNKKARKKISKSKRYLITGFVLSMMGGALTQLWYSMNSNDGGGNNGLPPVAQLTETKNEVQKRPAQRLIWQSLTNNSPLYVNDTVRTLESSDAKLQFLASGSEVHLEPESLVVITTEGDGSKLELLQGNMFVRGSKKDNLRVKVGENLIAVEDASLSTGKADGNAGTDLQIYSGQAKLLTKTGEVKIDKNSSGQLSASGIQSRKDPFKILSPLAQSEVHVLPSGADKVNFEWEKIKENLNISIEIGPNRKALTKLQADTVSINKLAAKLPPGDYFWRIVGADPKGEQKPVTSAIYRFRVLPKRPPVPTIPEMNDIVSVREVPSTVRFEWTNPGKLKSQVVEIADNMALKNSQVVRDLESDFYEFKAPQFKKYFWRVSGVIPSTGQIISSPVQQFTLRVKDELTRAMLDLPTPGQKVYTHQLKDQMLTLQWKPALGTKLYGVVVQKVSSKGIPETVADEKTSFTNLKVRITQPGYYNWKVQSISDDGKKTIDSETRQFAFFEAMDISWAKEMTDNQTYWSMKPELKLNWQTPAKNLAKFKIVVQSEVDPTQQVESEVAFGKLNQTVALPTPGRYIASIAGVNAQGQVLAKSSDRTFIVQAAPLLAAPPFADGLTTPMTGARDGSVDVAWRSVNGAKEYLVQIKDKDNKVISSGKTTGNGLKLSKLMPGKFTLSVAGVDPSNRPGQASERALTVPEKSNVLPPKFKGVTVE